MCRKFRYHAIHQTLSFPLSLPCPAISLSSHLIFSHNKFNPWHKWLFCFSVWPLVPATAVLVPGKMQCSGCFLSLFDTSAQGFTAWLTTEAVLKEGRTEGGLSSTKKICRIIMKTILQTYISHWSHLAWSKGHWILDLDQYADVFVQIPCRIKCWLSLLAEDLAIGRSSVQTLSPCVAVPRDPNS